MTTSLKPLPADDAVVAAPNHHEVIFENDSVRVLRTTLAVGDRTPLHSHARPMLVYFQQWSDIVQYDAKGEVTIDTRAMDRKLMSGGAVWTPAVPSHSTENVGADDLLAIAVEMKRD